MAEQLPRQLGRYTLLRRLGRGGMGQVFAARVEGNHGIQKNCVVKTLRPELAAEEEYVRRFLDEARLVMQLSHRNICSVFDAGEVDDEYYLAMDMVDGRNLRDVWDAARESGHPLSPALALHVAIEMLEGLDYAHRATDVKGRPLRVVHRDVSPQNVMLGLEGGVHLIDFGLAFSQGKVEKTDTDIVHGKVSYMAPEQVRGKEVDRRADVFAAAIVIFELLTHERFYDEVDRHLLVSTAAEGTHVPLAWSALKPELQKILRAALDPDPRQRLASAAAFADELRAYVSKKGYRADAADLRALMRVLFEDGQRDADVDRSAASRPRDTSRRIEVPEKTHVESEALSSRRPAQRTRKSPADPPGSSTDRRHFAGPAEPTAVALPPSHENMPRGERGPDDDDRKPAPRADRRRTKQGSEAVAPDARRAGGRVGPPAAEPTLLVPPPTTESDERRSPRNVLIKPAGGAPQAAPERKQSKAASTRDVVLRAGLLGAGLVGLFVLFIFFAPWQTQGPRPQKTPLPPRSTPEQKIKFVREWCETLACATSLDVAGSSDAADRCYRQCLGQ